MYFYCYVYATLLLRVCILCCYVCPVDCFVVLFCVLFVCKSVLYYRHRMSTQLQLTNISVSVYQYYGHCRSKQPALKLFSWPVASTVLHERLPLWMGGRPRRGSLQMAETTVCSDAINSGWYTLCQWRGTLCTQLSLSEKTRTVRDSTFRP
jgi:hypothetical protein